MKCLNCHSDNPETLQFCGECGHRLIPAEDSLISHTKTLEAPREGLTPGSTFSRRYQIIEELGKGGMGKVYKVYDTEIREKVALKLLRPDIAVDEKAIERFRNEVKIARKIAHRNVCRMYDLGEEKGTRYITMEYVTGEDLKSTIHRIGQLPIGKSISIAKQIFEGLAEAHRLEVIHRDLKPSNIMIDTEGNVRIMDFGIARFQEFKGITDIGTMIGTPDYMSPEQVEGKEVSKPSDIYSTGVILYEMLTGVVPFEGDTPLSIAVKHKTELPRVPKEFNSQIPDTLNQLILRCLEKKEENRYQSAEDVLSELNRIEKDLPTGEVSLEGERSFFWTFLRKLKERKIIETVAAFVGGGVALVEFAHHILVNHYHFSPQVVDYIIIILSVAMLCTVTWRWFRGGEVKRQRVRPLIKIKFKWIAALIVIALIIFGGYPLWKGFIQPEVDYEDFILLEVDISESQEIQKNLGEYLLLRSLEASTESRILVQEDFATYKERTESKDVKPSEPIIAIHADLSPKTTGFEGYDIWVEMNNRGQRLKRKFECKGPYDLLSNKINDIHSFISENSLEKIGRIEGDKTFSQICTDNWDALGHFLKGEEAWEKLKPDDAYEKYEAATENDKEFSLAYLRLAEVQLWRGDRDDAKKNLQIALKKKNKLIKHDMYRLQALQARLNFEPSKERQYLGRLVEDFPFKKEYRYELAEAYFHYGEADGAINHYKNALDLDSNYARAHNHIAFCYAWIGNHKKAEEHFQRYVELDNTANSFDSLATGYMFAGLYDEAIKALRRGRKLDPNLHYLCGNMARNLLLKGMLTKAIESLKEQSVITDIPDTKININFYLAFTELLKGNIEKSIQQLRPVKDFYSREKFEVRVDESPNLPLWLYGVVAFKKRDLSMLREMIDSMEKRLVKHAEKTKSEVNATNYFAIYKYYIHLKVLESFLSNDERGVLKYVYEGKKIRKKMGYWTSMFNHSYFFNEYAEILLKLDRVDQAKPLLDEALNYNPNCVAAHINMAKIHLRNNNLEEASHEYQKAKELLSNANKDYILVKKIEGLGKQLSSL